MFYIDNEFNKLLFSRYDHLDIELLERLFNRNGFTLTYKVADDPSITLKKYGEHVFENMPDSVFTKN